MTIEMKEVKFGDCFILSEDNKYLIVDCGSSNNSACKSTKILNPSQFAFSKIEPIIKSNPKQLDLLITHFDSDHFNGILEVTTPVFNTIYFPFCFLGDNQLLADTLAFAILVTSDRRFAANRMSDDLVNLFCNFSKILKRKGSLVSLASGDKVDLGGNSLNIEWPTRQVNYYIGHSDEIRLGINRISERIPESVRYITSNFSKSLLSFINIINEAASLEYDQIIEYTTDIRENYTRLLEVRTGFLYGYDTYTSDIPDMFRDFLFIAKSHLINDMNACSIIFHRKEDFVFFGDATKEIINSLINKKVLSAYYKVVKIQHHGTKKYYTPKTPKAEYYLISNGGHSLRPISDDFLNGSATEIYKTCCQRNKSSFCLYYSKNHKCYPRCSHTKQIIVP